MQRPTTHMLLTLGQDAFALPLLAGLSEADVHLHTVFVDHQATGSRVRWVHWS